MPESSTDRRRRPWRHLILAVVVLVLVLLAIGLWSEREDSMALPSEEQERVEEGY